MQRDGSEFIITHVRRDKNLNSGSGDREKKEPKRMDSHAQGSRLRGAADNGMWEEGPDQDVSKITPVQGCKTS